MEGGGNYPHRKKGQNKFQKTGAKALESERDRERERDWGGGQLVGPLSNLLRLV